MQVDFRLRGWKSSAALQDMVEHQLQRLRHFVSVSGAQVVLERSSASAPAWTARAHVQVPGPDLRAEARDHTVEAAWRKVLQSLYAEIGRRQERRRHRADERRRLRPSGRAA
jgi:ribosomal subunit interface protein